MSPSAYISIAFFTVFTSVHLFASLKNNKKVRNITKPFILLSLLGLYLSACPSPLTYVILALVFSWLGDVLLIGNGTKYFVIGGIFFMISHLFFVLSYSTQVDFSIISTPSILLFASVFAIAVFIIFRKLKLFLLPALFYPMFLYLLINGAMNCFAIFRMLSCFNLSTLLTAFGALLFFVSDSCLFFVRFNKECRMKSHFLVMLTYSVGELLIVLGLL